MGFLSRFAAAAATLAFLSSCNSSAVVDAYRVDASALRGHVYLIRGLIGEVFSRGLDNLAEKINQRGIAASVHSMYSEGALTELIMQDYRREPGPIILIGHSSGADVAIDVAERLRAAQIGVGIIFGFDPTPIAGRVPDNVELFVNLFQKTNPIGGGVVKSGDGFRGRLINVDLREHRDIIHITLDKSSKVHEAVVDEIVGFVNAARMQGEVTPAAPYGGQGAPPFIRPYFLAYVVPPNEPIAIWDSGVQIAAPASEGLQQIAAAYHVPVWLLAQVNRLDPRAPVPAGQALIVPQQMYQAAYATSSIPPPR